jgi:hypothetical protein
MERAAAAYETARTEAEAHGVAGERATAQAQRALALAFTDPARADAELDLAHHLLSGLDLHATTLTTRVAALSALSQVAAAAGPGSRGSGRPQTLSRRRPR